MIGALVRQRRHLLPCCCNELFCSGENDLLGSIRDSGGVGSVGQRVSPGSNFVRGQGPGNNMLELNALSIGT